jgi:molybdenum cofactor biosynthesis enzyme
MVDVVGIMAAKKTNELIPPVPTASPDASDY